jgi:hypothetical protein
MKEFEGLPDTVKASIDAARHYSRAVVDSLMAIPEARRRSWETDLQVEGGIVITTIKSDDLFWRFDYDPALCHRSTVPGMYHVNGMRKMFDDGAIAIIKRLKDGEQDAEN